MSTSAITWADEEWPIPSAPKKLDPTSGAILSKLAAVSDDDDCAWMTVPDLAKRCKCSERTVQTRLLALRGIETPQQAKAREKAGKPVPAVYLRLTDRTYRRGTRDVPIYELMVDYDVVAEVLRKRNEGRRSRAEVRAKLPQKARSMGANSCTHSGEADDAVCTRMGATVCTPNEDIREEGFATLTLTGARALETIADEIIAAWPSAHRRKTSRREVVKALRGEAEQGHDPELIAAGARGYAADRSAWGVSGDPMSPHKLIEAGRWEAFVQKADAARGLAGRDSGSAVPDWFLTQFEADHGKGPTGSYARPCGWRDDDQTLLARTDTAASWLRAKGYRVERLTKAEGVR